MVHLTDSHLKTNIFVLQLICVTEKSKLYHAKNMVIWDNPTIRELRDTGQNKPQLSLKSTVNRMQSVGSC